MLKRGEATWSEDLLVAVAVYGYVEEVYFTYSYSPIKAADGPVRGVFTAVNEMTQRVLSDRRMRILREFAARTAESKSVREACRTFAEVLGDNNPDIPFALLYLVDDDARGVSLQLLLLSDNKKPAKNPWGGIFVEPFNSIARFKV